MRHALISDIHANLEALEAVLNDVSTQRIDAIHCLGDVVGYGSDPLACLELVRANCETMLLGNHEHAALGHMDQENLNPVAQISLTWTQGQLNDRAFSIIAEFVMTRSFANFQLVHASPYLPGEWHYILTNTEADAAFRSFAEQLCFVGHTHLPMIFTEVATGEHRRKVGHDFEPDDESRYIVNVGSVGQPRDNDPRSCYAIFDTEMQEVLYRRVEYDIQKTQQKMQQANLPAMLINRLAAGR
ncbi:MAG: metallophosphoesterase family protein [bacterium]|nr:metallophosphoesterase family protein [bacterium]